MLIIETPLCVIQIIKGWRVSRCIFSTGICIAYVHSMWFHSLIPGGPLMSQLQELQSQDKPSTHIYLRNQIMFIGLKNTYAYSWRYDHVHDLLILNDIEWQDQWQCVNS